MEYKHNSYASVNLYHLQQNNDSDFKQFYDLKPT